MCDIFKLIKSSTYSVLGEWLDLETLTCFDTSICNKQSRHLLLEILSNPYFMVRNTIPSGPLVSQHETLNGLKWLKLRGIKLVEVVLKTKVIAHDVVLLRQLDFSKLDKMVIDCDLWSGIDNGLSFVKNCVKLTDLRVCGDGLQVGKAAYQIGRNCPATVKHLLIQSPFVSDAHIMHYIDNCYEHLESLNLHSCDQLTDNLLTYIGQRCKLLHSINLSYCLTLTSTGLCNYFQQYGEKLIEVNLEENNISDQVLITIATHCSALATLDINECKGLTMSAVGQIFKQCRALLSFITIHLKYDATNINNIMLTVKNSYTRNTVVEELFTALYTAKVNIHWLDLHECHKLTDATFAMILDKFGAYLTFIDVSQCKLLTNISLHNISEKCPQLRTLDMSYNAMVTEDVIQTIIDKNLELDVEVINLNRCKEATLGSIDKLSVMLNKF